jgi:hypothetical protein
MLLVHQHKPVPGLSLLERHQGLVDLRHGPQVNPGLELLAVRQLDALSDLLGGTDQATTDLDAASDKGETVEARQLLLRQAALDEGTVQLEEAEVSLQRHVCLGNGADDEVEGHGVGLVPVLVLLRRNVLGAHRLGVGALVGPAGNRNNLIRSQRLGKENSEVAESSESNDSDGLAGPAAVALQRRVHGDTGAEHGRENVRGERDVRQLDHEVAGDSCVVGVATPGLGAVGVLAVGTHHLGALFSDNKLVLNVEFDPGERKTYVALIADRAGVAVGAQTGAALRTNSDTVSKLDVPHLGTDADGGSNDLVADTDGVVGSSPSGAESVDVTACCGGDMSASGRKYRGTKNVGLPQIPQ